MALIKTIDAATLQGSGAVVDLSPVLTAVASVKSDTNTIKTDAATIKADVAVIKTNTTPTP